MQKLKSQKHKYYLLYICGNIFTENSRHVKQMFFFKIVINNMDQQQYCQVINTNKYRLEVIYQAEKKELKMELISKINHCPLILQEVKFPNQIMGQDRLKTFRKFRRYRELYIQIELGTVKLKKEEEDQELVFIPAQCSSAEKQKALQRKDLDINSRVKYWSARWKRLQMQATMDLPDQKIHVIILQKNPLKIAEGTLSLKTPRRKQIKQLELSQGKKIFIQLFGAITRTNPDSIRWDKKELQITHPFFKRLCLTVTLTPPQQEQRDSESLEKITLFKHIFLTEVITHMITSQFGRSKVKKIKNRYGNQSWQYMDEELQELRSCGSRFSQFRDHPLKKEKKCDKNQEKQKQQILGMAKKGKKQKEKKKTELERVGHKLKFQRKKAKDIQNFIVISGRQKSKINTKRYCFHQMMRETDKTEAMINFVQFVFEVEPRKEIVCKWEAQTNYQRSLKIKNFLAKVKVKRRLIPCLIQYTRDSFFHKVLNIGLRVFCHPHELAYLRLPFSHLFWGIKILYRRYKRSIFKRKTKVNENRVIKLYRGCQIGQKEIKILSQNIGGYIEAQGFLSTSQKRSIAAGFAVNVFLIIEIPVTNLKGTFDNGMAKLYEFSDTKQQWEVLINTFNVFKILKFMPAKKNEKMHIFSLEYGSMKRIEEKVKKSDDLLEAEDNYRDDCKELIKIKRLIVEKKQDLTQHEYEELMSKIPLREEELKNTKEELKQLAEKEYAQALQKLSQWEKQLIVNSKHQQKHLENIDTYGQLLICTGQHERACIYLEKRLKQVEMEKAMEGHQWKKNQCISRKQLTHRMILQYCYSKMGKIQSYLNNSDKILYLFKCKNIQPHHKQYYQLLFRKYLAYELLIDREKERNACKQQLMLILTRYNLTQTFAYQYMGQNKQKEKESGEDKKEDEDEQKVEALEKQLENISLHEFGKYSPQYLKNLAALISVLYQQQNWASMMRRSKQYLNIRLQAPQVETRITTCNVFVKMMQSFEKESHPSGLTLLSPHITQFHSHIHNYVELHTAYAFLSQCLKHKKYRTGRMLAVKVMHGQVRCKIKEDDLYLLILYGYVLLLLCRREESILNRFIRWGKAVYAEQSYTESDKYKKLMSYIGQYNDEYQKGDKSVEGRRKKEYQDAIITHSIQCFVRNGTFPPPFFQWKPSIGQLLPWQHPFQPLYPNTSSIIEGIAHYLEAGELTIVFYYLQQYLSMNHHILQPPQMLSYLSLVRTVGKLHLSEWELRYTSSLLDVAFDDATYELQMLQNQRDDFLRAIKSSQQLKESNAELIIKMFAWRKAVEERELRNQTAERRIKGIRARYKLAKAYFYEEEKNQSHKQMIFIQCFHSSQKVIFQYLCYCCINFQEFSFFFIKSP